MSEPLRLRDVLLILGLGLVVMGAGLGLRDPWPADEPVFALIARDMLASGNWLIPMVGGDYFQDKPPLLFWLQAAGYWLTGSEQVGFLLPSLLAGLGTLLLVYDLGRRLWNREAGLHAALLLLVTVQFALQARRGQQDGAAHVLHGAVAVLPCCASCCWVAAGAGRWARALRRGWARSPRSSGFSRSSCSFPGCTPCGEAGRAWHGNGQWSCGWCRGLPVRW